MQNKGIVIVTAVLLTLASIFYLSFSAATKYYDSQAAKIKDPIAQQDYKDSVKYLGIYSYQKCLETQIGLGLDLKGGMNVILEVSVPDVLENLADHKVDAAFVKSMKEARAEHEVSQSDFITLFINAFKKNAPGRHLSEIFATQQLQGKVSPNSSDKDVEKVLRTEVQAAIDNSFLVVRTRIDKFGVVQPNIQKLEGLFVLVGALVETGVIKMLAVEAIKLTNGSVNATAMLILWMSAFASAFIDNIPVVATLIPLIKDMGQLGLTNLDPMWWSLALGACLGGNGTLIGASANVVVASMAAQRGKQISFLGFMKIAFPVMVLTVAISSVYVCIRYL